MFKICAHFYLTFFFFSATTHDPWQLDITNKEKHSWSCQLCSSFKIFFQDCIHKLWQQCAILALFGGTCVNFLGIGDYSIEYICIWNLLRLKYLTLSELQARVQQAAAEPRKCHCHPHHCFRVDVTATRSHTSETSPLACMRRLRWQVFPSCSFGHGDKVTVLLTQYEWSLDSALGDLGVTK